MMSEMEEGGTGGTKAGDGGPPPDIPVTGGLAPLPDTGAGYENAGGSDDDDDLEDLDRHHSLPTPEEIKVDRPSTTSPFGKNFWLQLLVMIVLLLALTIGLAVGLTKRKARIAGTSSLHENPKSGSGSGTGGSSGGGGGSSNLPPNTGTSSQKDRRSQIKDYVIAKGVSQAIDFEKGDSAQSLALDFLSYIDQMNLPVPQSNTGSHITDQGYRLITRYVISVVYYSTSGPTNWEWDLNFMNPTEDVCNWYTQSQLYGFEGVNCLNSDGVLTMEIQSLRFVLNGLVGTLPKELSALTTLTGLGSIANFISGSIPNEYESLTNLKTLFLGLNLLTGPVPKWIAHEKMADLSFVYLSDNFLTGTIPWIKSEARKNTITVLALDDNNLDGSLNIAWQLPNLLVLYLEQNNLNGTLPSSIVATNPKLIELDISENFVHGALPSDWYKLTDLEILDLHGNNLSNLIPSSQDLTTFNTESKLKFIGFQDNELSGKIPPSLAYDCPGLVHLDVSNNFLTGTIPFELSTLGQELHYLFVGENNFTPGPFPTFIHDNMLALRELEMQDASLTGQIPAGISSMTNLILLDLSRNSLAGAVPAEITQNLENLQFLLLNDNNLNGQAPGLGKMNRLQFVLLDKNSFTGSMDGICGAPSLKLAVSDCQEEVTCTCCAPCCKDGEDCHDFDLVDTIDWETGYERRFFNFGNGTDSIEVIPGAP